MFELASSRETHRCHRTAAAAGNMTFEFRPHGTHPHADTHKPAYTPCAVYLRERSQAAGWAAPTVEENRPGQSSSKCSAMTLVNSNIRSRERGKTGPGRIRTYDQGIHFAPAFPPGVDYLFTREGGARLAFVRVRDARACDQGRCSPQVVSAPSAGVPAAWLRIAMDARCASEGFPEFIPSTSRVSARRHLFNR